MVTTLSLDYESASDLPLTGPSSVGLHNYANDLSTRITLMGWSWNDGPVERADLASGGRIAPEVLDGLRDPHVQKWAFNAQFERVMTRDCLGVDTPVENWRCTMALAYMQSFTGDLGAVGAQIGLRDAALKDTDGKRLIRMFSQPQKPTRNQPHVWRGPDTDPEDWARFVAYNVQDVVAEGGIKRWLLANTVLEREWLLYEIDQVINGRGLPTARRFVESAMVLVRKRRAELTSMLGEVTGLRNANSPAQLLPWLRERGYPFADLKKDTVKKVIHEARDRDTLAPEALAALRLRQQAARTSVKKYDAIACRLAPDDRLRYCFQFAGASRTSRWAGRGPQPHNLVRTPFKVEGAVEALTEAIADQDTDLLDVLIEEPMAALAGCIRSSFQAPPGKELVVCDLKAIETAVIAWLAGCKRLLRVFAEGRDPYKDFATELYQKAYDEITSAERNICKPPQLGCGYGLGGGKLKDGKRTGLWGYAEGMGVDISQEAAQQQVRVWREVYFEIPELWSELERAVRGALDGREVNVAGKLRFAKHGEFLTVRLPSGRIMYYHRPRIERREFKGETGPYTKRVFTHMGMSQVTKKWQRVIVGGPRLVENFVQAIARDVLGVGMRRAHKRAFEIVGSVHDELIGIRDAGDERFGLAALRDCMISPIRWATGMPLDAAGYVSTIYRKD